MTDVRLVLRDDQWLRMEPHCHGKAGDPGRSGGDNRMFLEAVLWIARTGSPWRDLSGVFSKWNTVFRRYRDRVKADVFQRLFEVVSGDPDMEFAMIDGIAFDGLIADKAFDSNAIIADLDARGAAVVISRHPGRAQKLKIDADIYKWHHLIENVFRRLKEFKRTAMRACKTDRGFEAMIYLAAAVIHSR